MSTRFGIKCLLCAAESEYFTTDVESVFALIHDFPLISKAMATKSWETFGFSPSNSEVSHALKFLEAHKEIPLDVHGERRLVPIDQFGRIR